MRTCDNMQTPCNHGSPLEEKKYNSVSSSSQIRGRMIYHMQVLLPCYLQTLTDIEYWANVCVVSCDC